MNKFKLLAIYMKKPLGIFAFMNLMGFHWLFSDKTMVKILYKSEMRKNLNLKDPKTFSEKLQWLKLYDRKPIYTKMVDKYEAKNYVASIIGEEYVIPTLGVWDKFEDIDFDKLPNQFVLKTTHDSGGVVICKDKSTFDVKKAKKKLKKSLRRNYFYKYREWPYKDVKPRIIAEKYMSDNSGGLVDYKFFCFNGNVNCVMVCIDRHKSDVKFYFFNEQWQLLRLNVRGKNAPEGFTLPKPKNIDKMFEIAKTLSKDLPFARIDLYECDEQIYFGETTFFPSSGLDSNILEETNIYWGKLLQLPKNDINN